MPFAKKWQRHGRNRRKEVVPDRAFRKKASKARSKTKRRGRLRPCLLEKNVKGTVEIGAKRACVTVPFAKKRQRHGQNRSAEGVRDRAFCKKAAKARSKPERSGRPRPCLLQKTLKARSKPERSSRLRPCLLQKNVKGTVKIGAEQSPPTVPFAKKRQRHGQNRSEAVAPDRAFWRKTLKARSKPERSRRARPCLLQKNVKGTVKTGAKQSCPTVPFGKNRQRHGQNRSEEVVPDRASCKKTRTATLLLQGDSATTPPPPPPKRTPRSPPSCAHR